MNAIVPLNIAAIRVNQNDYNKVTGNFQGKTAAFEKMPWADPANSYGSSASTGDKIFHPLGVTPGGGPVSSPANQLGTGVHLHWQLPDYFRRGVQEAESATIHFPHVPNRWLVVRYLSIYDTAALAYSPVTSKSWIVESDYVTASVSVRPAISVPLPAVPDYGQQPYMYMGRVVDYEHWNPAAEPASDYLPSYTGTDGQSLYLTSTGFVGAHFGSYYPECCSVFGFWDNFSDVTPVYAAITGNNPIQFRATYQVIGWLNDATADPLATVIATVTDDYNKYVKNCTDNNTLPVLTPIDFFNQITRQKMKWSFNQKDLSYTLSNNQIQTLNVPTQTICAGTMQEIVWNMSANTGTTYFLQSSGSNQSVWPATTEIAIGNSTEEALSALLKYDMNQQTNDPDVLDNYEFLLDALQLGLLNNIEKTPNKLIALEEALHSNAFSKLDGGYVWMITNIKDADKDTTEKEEVSLPIVLAEQLYLLNQAQKNYDMGRGGLATMRRQLFMDWVRYVKIYCGETSDPNIDSNAIANFIWTSSGGELNAVINQGKGVGVLSYVTDKTSGEVTGLEQPHSSVSPASIACTVWNSYTTVLDALAAFNEAHPTVRWILQCGPAPHFYMPAEPVVLMEGSMIEPPQRNGDGVTTFVRLGAELLSQIHVTYHNTVFTVESSGLKGVPVVNTNLPATLQSDVQALVGEAFLITPMLASVVATALATTGGNNNPAVIAATDFSVSLMYAQGGLSPLDIVPHQGGIPASAAASLFTNINADDFIPAANPVITVTAPQALQILFTNAQNNGWVPDSISWNTQQAYTEFSATRADPFLPVFLIWSIKFNPLQWEKDAGNQVYAPTNITDFFALGNNHIELSYKMNGKTAVNFTSSNMVGYSSMTTMRSGAPNVVSFQITNYISSNPNDPENKKLAAIAKLYGNRKILSQSLGGFNINQVLTSYVAQVAVENLVFGGQDTITSKLAQAATATPRDNWYNGAFTSLEPIATDLKAQGNFGPLRAGFMDVTSIEIVDVFGQRMDLNTATQTADGSLSCTTSYAMSPQQNDTANTGKIYLAPRIMAPTRLWFQWLSASFDASVPGINNDFVEMNSHPATSPVCGWVLPNHLDNTLFFYNADGAAIGSFGVEHIATKPVLQYRTRAGNLANPGGTDLSADIGKPGKPSVNAHLANFMWYLNGQAADFLIKMMKAIQHSDTFINPSNYAQDASLSVFIGRPLALTRVVAGMETLGNLLPLSQADTNANSPFPQDVNNQRCNYTDRMNYSSANLASVQFPVRLGDLANLDDGLVGYIMEGTGVNPYTGQNFYAPAAEKDGGNGVQQPTSTTLQLTLNAPVIPITLLVDPRAPVHATTGVLAVNELRIPPDQYSQAMSSLAVHFITRPVLQMAQGLIVPLPSEKGYGWSWIAPGTIAAIPLKPNAVNGAPAYGYTPQTIQEGWVQLTPDTTTS